MNLHIFKIHSDVAFTDGQGIEKNNLKTYKSFRHNLNCDLDQNLL